MTANYRHGNTAGFMALCLIVGLIFIPVAAGATTWNVSNVGGEYNSTSLLDIEDNINDGDIIRIWGVDGYTYEGGITIDKPDVLITRWEGSPARPLITNTSVLSATNASAITIKANNITLCGLDISGNSLTYADTLNYWGRGAGVNAVGTWGERIEKLTIIDCIFSANSVSGDEYSEGGAISAYYINDFSVRDTMFKENRAGYGAAVYLYGGSSVFSGNTIAENTATGYGGGVYAESSTATIENTTINNNTAGYGGGICARSTTATIENTTIENNTATNWGGGVYGNSGNITIEKSTIENNTATNWGGGVSVRSATVVIGNTTINNNKATKSGGGVFTLSTTVTIGNTIINNNTATDDGGGVYAELMDQIDIRVTIENTIISNNKATKSGGGMCALQKYIYGKILTTIENTTINNNTANSNGGGTYFQNSPNAILTTTTFENNTAEYGGGTYFQNSPNAILTTTTFENNTAEYGGGTYFQNSPNAILTATTFENNTAMIGGGGAYFEDSGEVTLTGTTFVTNKAEEYGGGAVFMDSTPALTDTIFEHNMAESGAGVFFVNSVTTLADTTFVNNSATNDGAGIFVTGRDTDTRLDRFTVRDCLFSNNTMTDDGSKGGAMYLQYVDNIAITNTTFEKNRANYGGGAYLYMSDNAALTNTTFRSNVGSLAGGGAHFNNSNSDTLTETTFDNNTAFGGAGAFFIESDDATLTKTTFENNTAMVGGGGAFFRLSDNAVIKNCLFDNDKNLGADESSAGAVLNEATPIPGPNIAGGPYLGGNVWLRDSAQNISEWGADADFDGICDQPLEINISGTVFGTDAFPLMYGRGTVTVTSTPAGADIHLDGVKITRTTDGSLYLPVGEHTITVSREGYVTPATKPVMVVAGETTSVTFTLEKIPTPTRAPGGHSSGGGCSDLSAGAANGLPAGGNASFTMQNSAIHEIRITAGESIQKILITVGKTGLPSGTDAPTDNIYEYDEVLIYHATGDMIAGATLNFSVSKAWLTEKGFAPGDVVLYRLHDGEWQKLLITLTGEDTGSYYFTARSPGFSVFAIGAEQSTEVAATQTPVFAEEKTVTPTTTQESTQTPAEDGPTPKQSPIPYGLPVLAAGLAYLLKKRRE